MKSLGACLVFVCLAVCASAEAADWSGPYVGLLAGYGTANGNSVVTVSQEPWSYDYFAQSSVGIINNNPSSALSSDAVLAGIRDGYNFQFRHLVVGLEADLSSLPVHEGTGEQRTYAAPYAPNGFEIKESVDADWIFSVGPRLGLSYGRFLISGTIGFAASYVRFLQTFTDNYAASESLSYDGIAEGLIGGLSLDYALSDRWSLRADYLNVNFGGATVSTNGVTDAGWSSTGTIFNDSFTLMENLFQLGVDYRY